MSHLRCTPGLRSFHSLRSLPAHRPRTSPIAFRRAIPHPSRSFSHEPNRSLLSRTFRVIGRTITVTGKIVKYSLFTGAAAYGIYTYVDTNGFETWKQDMRTDRTLKSAEKILTHDPVSKLRIPPTHIFQHGSNPTCEDYYTVEIAPGVKRERSTMREPWAFWGVFDGHAGFETSKMLSESLVPAVSIQLNQPGDRTVTESIRHAFVEFDSAMMNRAIRYLSSGGEITTAEKEAIAPALSGSCALLAAYDPRSFTLRVACTGDSRAVLGRWDPAESRYIAMPLSADQTGFNQDEFERLTREHPDEPFMLDRDSGRLLGMAVTRAFGDHRWKWAQDTIQHVKERFGASSPRPHYKSPPYMTAEPAVTETAIVGGDSFWGTVTDSARADFLIMASDGLWDRISSEHAVELVQRWLERKESAAGFSRDATILGNFPFEPWYQRARGTLDYNPETKEHNPWKAEPEFFIVEDNNAATCLARNALGGVRRDLVNSVLSMKPPESRWVRDDMTIVVVFFGRDPSSWPDIRSRLDQKAQRAESSGTNPPDHETQITPKGQSLETGASK